MKITRIARQAQRLLRTERGREAGRSLTDRVADTARRRLPRQAARVDSAQRSVHGYLDRQDPARGARPQDRDPRR